MYCSATTTRLLVGMFTPAIRATDFSPVADPFAGSACFSYLGRCPQTRTRRPPLGFPGARHRLEKPSDWIDGLLKDSIRFRQPSLCFSSLFRDLFRGFLRCFPGHLPGSLLGGFAGLPGSLRRPLF